MDDEDLAPEISGFDATFHTDYHSQQRLTSIESSAMHRDQLTSLVLEVEFPATAFRRHELLITYRSWFDIRGKVMQPGVDCVLLLYFARMNGLSHLGLDVERLHTSAVRQLGKAVQQAGALQDDGVLGAIEALAIAGQFRELAPTGELWTTHMQGLETVLKLRGPETLTSHFARNVLFNFLPIILVKALAERRPLFLGEMAWQNAVKPYCTTSMSRLAMIATKIPVILADFDGGLKEPGRPSVETLIDVMERVAQLREEIEAWLSSWQAGSCSSFRGRCRIVPLETEFPTFQQQFRHLDSFRPFSLTYLFDDLLDAIHYVWYWLCVLELTKVQLTVTTLTADAERWFSSTALQLTRQCNELAESMTKTIPYLHSREDVPYVNATICTTISFASSWYQSSGQPEYVRWCHNIRNECEDPTFNNALHTHTARIKRVFAGWPMFVD